MADFLVKLGASLLKYGSSTHRIEQLITLTAQLRGFSARAFAVPTGLWLGLSRPERGDEIVRLIRVHDWAVDLGKLSELDVLFNQVADGALPLDQASRDLERIEQRPGRYGAPIQAVAGSLASGSAALFFGGGLREVIVGTLLGLLVTLMQIVLGRFNRTRLLLDFLAGLVAGLTSWAATSVFPDLLRKPLILATVIIVVPGMTLTAGIGELAHRNLVSGAARMFQAMMVLLSLVFGLGLAFALETAASGGLKPLIAGQSAPFWQLLVGTAVAGGAFVALLDVPLRFALPTIGSGVLAWIATVGAERLVGAGAESALLGALTLGLYSNLLARITERPKQLFLTPGIIMLVPGAFGFLSFGELLAGDVARGTAHVFQTLIIGTSLIIGLLLADALLPPRKVL